MHDDSSNARLQESKKVRRKTLAYNFIYREKILRATRTAMSKDENQRRMKTPKNNMVEKIYPFNSQPTPQHSNNKQQTCD